MGLGLVPLEWLIDRFTSRRIDLLVGLALFGVALLLFNDLWLYYST